MKNINISIIICCVFAIASCNKKHNSNRELNCFDSGKQCTIDSQYVGVLSNPDQTCYQWDGVNVKNISAPVNGKIGDSIAFNLDAVAIDSGANGSVLFATAQDDEIVEVKTYLQYNICNTATQMLNNINTTYYFVPKKEGDYRFTFINVYGDRTRFTILIKK